MSNLDCCQFEKLLEQAVEQRQAPGAELRDHALSCETCRTLWEEFLILEEAIPAWTAARPTVDLVDAVMHAMATDTETTTAPKKIEPLVALTVAGSQEPDAPRRRRFVLPAIATTAAALLLVSAVFYLVRPKADEPQIAAVPPDISLGRSGATPRIQLEQPPSEMTVVVADAGSAYLQLASSAASAITDGAALFPSTKLIADATPKPNPNQKSWIQKFETNLEPLQKDLGSAFEFLFEAPAPEPSPAT